MTPLASFIQLLLPGDFVDLRAIQPNRAPIARRLPAIDLPAIEGFARTHADANIYFGVATRATTSSGTLENCRALGALFVDIDFKDYQNGEDEARACLASFPLSPSIVVATGGGLHAYWVLDEPIELSSGGAPRAKHLLRALAQAVGGDLRVAEPARVLRLPGTRNVKYSPPRDVEIEILAAERRYRLADLDAALPETGDEGAASGEARGRGDVPQTVGEGGRNDTLFREASALRQRGYEEEEIRAALTALNGRAQPPLATEEIARIAKSAARYPAGQDDFVLHASGRRAGHIVADHQGNIRLALTKLGLTFSYNAFAAKTLVTYNTETRPLDDAVLHRAWLQIDELFRFRPGLEFFQILIGDLARRHRFHPVRDYLDGLTWDGTPRLETWLTTYGGAADTDYTRAVGRIFLIAAVRRVRTPGAKFDELPILEAEQGTFKSQALRALCARDDWFSDDLPLGVDAKQIIERTAGKWLIEASEMHGYSNASVDRLKGMLARQVDGPVRLAYGRTSVEVPRQFVTAGTTNHLTEYLRDSTGNRRFWPVRVTRFDVDALSRDRDQVWAEAAARESTGAAIRLPQALWALAAVEQEARRQVDPWEELLDDRLAGGFDREAILVSDLWDALGDAGKQYRVNEADRLAKILQRRGFNRKKKVNVPEGRRRWAWIREGADPSSIPAGERLGYASGVRPGSVQRNGRFS